VNEEAQKSVTVSRVSASKFKTHRTGGRLHWYLLRAEDRNSFPLSQRLINTHILSGSGLHLVTGQRFEGGYEGTFYTIPVCYIIRPLH